MAVIEWDQRELCPDGGCVGVIGDGGTCSVCGRVAPGDRPARPVAAPAEDVVDDDGGDDGEGDDGDDDDLGPDAEIGPDADLGPADAPAWTERQLCSDGACTGVIGDDGHCRVCGKEPG